LIRTFTTGMGRAGKVGALVLAFAAGTVHGSLTLVDIFTSGNFQQTSSAPPTKPYGEFVSLGASFQNAGDFDSASASYPGPGTQALTLQGNGFTYETGYFPTLASLRSAFPFGTYDITAHNSGTSSSQTGQINYAADYFTSTVPTVSPASYNSLQNYDPTESLNVSFNAFTPNPNVSDAYTYFTIYDATTIDSVFSSGALPASTTSFVIPANALQPDTSYLLELDFSDRLNGTDSVDDVPTLQGFNVNDDLDFTTAVPEPLSAAVLGAVPCVLLLRRKR
jgi:hypothetical protein